MSISTEFEKTDPSKFLSDIIGSMVTVKLHNGVEYKGNLQTIDGFMNVVLEDGKESVNGSITKEYGDVFIRGNNGPAPAPAKPTNPIARYRAAFFDGDNASGKPFIHLAIVIVIFGYSLEYQHLKAHH
ncbi:U6 snRNA-associated Sm-like protein LSm6 [Candida tropicalis]